MRKYSVNELYCDNFQKSYNGNAKEAAFLLGGIGTGNISIGARGELRNWQIFNEPGQNNYMPYTFFAIRAEEENRKAVCRVLESKLSPPFSKSQGYLRGELAGLPRFDDSVMKSKYPFVNIEFRDDEMPVLVRAEAFTPFIPLNADDSGIPGFYLTYYIKNPLNRKVRVSIAGTVDNPVGFEKYDNFSLVKRQGRSVNTYFEQDEMKGIVYSAENINEMHIANGTMCLATNASEITVKPLWVQGEWTDGAEDFWEDFSNDGKLDRDSKKIAKGCEWAQASDYGFLHFTDAIGSVCAEVELEPEEEKSITFVLSWFFPNRPRVWNDLDKHKTEIAEGKCDIVKNYYASLFSGARHVAEYMFMEYARLERESRKFANAFYQTTLPGYVLEAVADNITVLRSPTCFRIEGGNLLGWEGVENELGCGAGNCTHVWNYAQTLAFLFPELEQRMRKIEFVDEIEPDGYMPFRSYRSLGLPMWRMVPSADGQLGAVIRVYREWVLSNDREFLKMCFPGVERTMEYAVHEWDADKDGVLEKPQHVTYDTELYGYNTMTTTIYLEALEAAAFMAEELGRAELAKHYRKLSENGAKKVDEKCFNGEYYEQVIDNVDDYRYQYGKGCLSDQLLGEFMAICAGLNPQLPFEHIKKAVSSIFCYNFVDRAKNNVHSERAYILNEEKGLTPCTWPKGGRPRFPFVYYGEVWTGIEYEVATLLLYCDMLDEGLSLVKTVRDRQDGYRRNPWSENESGYYYTRAMASYGIFLTLTGVKYDMKQKKISFSPKINKKNFRTFFSTGSSWGIYSREKNCETGEVEEKIEILYGSEDLHLEQKES